MQWRRRNGSVSRGLLGWAYEHGLMNHAIGLRRSAITVLCYHRIGSATSSSTSGYIGNISATPENFERQCEYICSHFTPIGVSDLSESISRPERLPPRPIVVTFDDGYKDNAEMAWPILRKRVIPAIVFLVTDHIGTDRPLLCDYVAYCFQQTKRTFANVAPLGPTYLQTSGDRGRATAAWLARTKALPASARWPAAKALRSSLDVTVPDSAFWGLYLSWDDVRRLASEGMEFGGHTRTHPILAKMPIARARAEIAGSHERIRAELGQPPVAFAYPNGSRGDFDVAHERAVRDAGYSVAFSIEAGPMSIAEIRRRPMAIRRIYIGIDDNMPRFAAKLTGAYRLMQSQPFPKVSLY